MSINVWLEKQKKYWNLIGQGTIWLITIVTSMLLSPVAIVFGEGFGAISRIIAFAGFIVAIIIVITYLIAQTFSEKKYAWLWVISACIFLILSSIAIFKNNEQSYLLLCRCGDENIIKGTKFQRLMDETLEPDVPCSRVCLFVNKHTGKVDPSIIWTENSINQSRRKLLVYYLICFPLVALTIISTLQALFCFQRRPKRSDNKKPSAKKKPSKDSQSVAKIANNKNDSKISFENETS